MRLLRTGIEPRGIWSRTFELLRRGGRIRHDHLAAVDDAGEELVGDELVEPLVIDEPVAVVLAEEVLADEDRDFLLGERGRQDFLAVGDERAGGVEGDAGALGLGLVLGGLERQIEHGEGEHHLGEVARGLGEMGGEEEALAVVAGVVAPEGVHGHEVGELLLVEDVVVVVLGPFLRGVEGAVEGADGLAARLVVLAEFIESDPVRLLLGLGILRGLIGGRRRRRRG